MKKKSQALETVVHGVFLLLGLITVGCVLLISVYLIVSGIPAIRQIGLIPFLFGKTWASTAAERPTASCRSFSQVYTAPRARSCSACRSAF